LLLAGADASLRTHSGALPYHLAGLQMIRTMLEDMGGPDAVPPQGDAVDMVAILSELTIAETTIVAGTDGTFEVMRRSDNSKPQQQQPQIQAQAHVPGQAIEKRHKEKQNSKERDESKEQFVDVDLHSGPALGVLPSLNKNNSPSKSPNKSHSSSAEPSSGGKKKKKNKHNQDIPKDMPPQYICSISHRPMSEPVKSTYGHVFEKSAIERWFTTQGKICPFTGRSSRHFPCCSCLLLLPAPFS
jgi:hypothetical protein